MGTPPKSSRKIFGGRRRKSLSMSGSFLLSILAAISCVIVCGIASSVPSGYSKKFYQSSYSLPQPIPLSNGSNSALMFEPRDGGGGGGGNSFGGSGGYDMGGAGGGYGAPAPMASPAVMYKYQIYPNPPMMQSMGWGWGMEEEEDDDMKDFPKELLGLLGLKGLKGLKLPLLLKLLKILKIPLLPIILPLLLPLFLLKLALLLLIPVPVLAIGGRKLLENSALQPDLKEFLKSKLEMIISAMPQDFGRIHEKIEENKNKVDSNSPRNLKQPSSPPSSFTSNSNTTAEEVLPHPVATDIKVFGKKSSKTFYKTKIFNSSSEKGLS